MTINRRITQRHDVVVPARLAVDGETHEVVIENLSLGGAQIAFNKRLAMGRRVQLSFQIPVREEAIEIVATVRWSSQASIGLQFEGLRARDVWALNNFFAALG